MEDFTGSDTRTASRVRRLMPLTFTAPKELVDRLALLAAHENEMPSRYWRKALANEIERYETMPVDEARAEIVAALDEHRGRRATIDGETERVNVRVPEVDLERARTLADVLQQTVSEIMRRAGEELANDLIPRSRVEQIRDETVQRFERRLALFQRPAVDGASDASDGSLTPLGNSGR